MNPIPGHPSVIPPPARRILTALLVTFLVQSGGLQAGPIVVDDSAQGTAPSRSDDRLSPAEFADPPVHSRPGSFWDWLNGSITKEQAKASHARQCSANLLEAAYAEIGCGDIQLSAWLRLQ